MLQNTNEMIPEEQQEFIENAYDSLLLETEAAELIEPQYDTDDIVSALRDFGSDFETCPFTDAILWIDTDEDVHCDYSAPEDIEHEGGKVISEITVSPDVYSEMHMTLSDYVVVETDGAIFIDEDQLVEDYVDRSRDYSSIFA